MKIGNIELSDYPVFLAPMEDVTDIGFRQLCKRFGADVVYTEFVSSDALIRDVKRTKEKITYSEEERPIGIQIYGSDPDAMVEAAKRCEEANPDLIDINFGCPVRKIAGRGAGSGMMRTPEVMLEITEKVVKAVKRPGNGKNQARVGRRVENYRHLGGAVAGSRYRRADHPWPYPLADVQGGGRLEFDS